MQKIIFTLSFIVFSSFAFASSGKSSETKYNTNKVEERVEEGPGCMAAANAAFDVLESTGNYSSHELTIIYNSMIAACTFAP